MNYQKLDKREQKYDKTIYKNLYSVHARTGRKNFTLVRQNQEKEVHELKKAFLILIFKAFIKFKKSLKSLQNKYFSKTALNFRCLPSNWKF